MTALNLGQVCGNAAAVGPGTPALGSLSPLSPVGGWVSGEGRIAGPVSPPPPGPPGWAGGNCRRIYPALSSSPSEGTEPARI